MAAEQRTARVFHVEDDTGMQHLTRRILEIDRHEIVLLASSVAEALPYIPDALIEHKVNIGVFDNNLPDGTGEEVATRVRESGLQIPILSHSVKEDITWGDYNISKLPKRGDLLVAVSRALEEFSGNGESS